MLIHESMLYHYYYREHVPNFIIDTIYDPRRL